MLLTRSQAALLESVTVAQSPQHVTPPSPTRRHHFLATLGHSPRQISIPMARRWKRIAHVTGLAIMQKYHANVCFFTDPS